MVDMKQCYECNSGGVPATEENMAKYGWVRERTCTVESWRDSSPWTSIQWILSCGDTVEWDYEKPPNYCPWCGAKVVD